MFHSYSLNTLLFAVIISFFDVLYLQIGTLAYSYLLPYCTRSSFNAHFTLAIYIAFVFVLSSNKR
ncbi:hypothetical protein CPC08DRAFT_656813 [Agrocybe pediades]|nr:hypothetical protein CPC08DRAFT_656813 [Agrocybe pediades]